FLSLVLPWQGTAVITMVVPYGTIPIEERESGTATPPLLSNESGVLLARTDENQKRNSSLMTGFLVLNYMIGSGILNTPQTFRDSGIAATTVLYCIACPAVWLGSVALIRAGEEWRAKMKSAPKKLEFAALAKDTLAPTSDAPDGVWLFPCVPVAHNWSLIVDGSIVLQNTGAVCSYVILLGGLATSLLSELLEYFEVTGWWDSFYFVTPFVVFTAVLYVSSLKHFGDLSWVAGLSLCTISFLFVYIVTWSHADAAAARDLTVGKTALDAPLVWWNWNGFFRKIGSVVFALTCAPAAFHSYNPMKNRTESEWERVITTSVILGGGMCYFTGLFGYLSFRDAVDGDILSNLSGFCGRVFKFLVAFHLVCYIPGEVIVLRSSLFGLLGMEPDTVSGAWRVVWTAGILGLIVLTVSQLKIMGAADGDIFGNILDLTGGVAASLTNFVIPALIYLNAPREGKGQYHTACMLLYWLGGAFMVIVPVAVFQS
ncbi:unnamed protein product, partial [Ectocarpus sp. 13 AM-2016]